MQTSRKNKTEKQKKSRTNVRLKFEGFRD